LLGQYLDFLFPNLTHTALKEGLPDIFDNKFFSPEKDCLFCDVLMQENVKENARCGAHQLQCTAAVFL